MATAGWAVETDNLSPEPQASINVQAAVLLVQTDAVLGLGSTGSAVKDLQAMLALMGYYAGAVDGTYEQMTEEAVRQFQTDAGLTVDGVVGPLTWRRLLPTPATLTETQVPAGESGSTSSSENHNGSNEVITIDDAIAQTAGDLPTLQFDDVGAEVERLQTRLAALSFYTGPVDGVFGIHTEQSVQQFQEQAGLIVDGIVGPETWLKLLR